MKNYIAEGKTITVNAPVDMVSSEPYVVGRTFGIASNTVKEGDPVELYVQGIWELRKDKSEFKAGEKVYFDPKAKADVEKDASGAEREIGPKVTRVTSVAKDTILIGIESQNATKDDAVVRVRLNGISI